MILPRVDHYSEVVETLDSKHQPNTRLFPNALVFPALALCPILAFAGQI